MSRLFIFIIITFFAACKSDKNSWTCIDGDCENGFGMRLWSDGGYEKGNWINGKLNGNGEQFFGTTSEFSGDKYEGQFFDDLYNGKGIYESKKDDTKFGGEWKNGKPEGKGFLTFGKNSVIPGKYYDGSFKDGKKDGFGILFLGLSGKFANCKYTGEWENNKMHGNGIFVWADSSYYEGPWEFDKQEGEGVFVFKNGETFKGYWKGGVCNELMEKMGRENYLKLYW